jgi:radical SAM superfamily enzyme YgiQ (UPF0313 family)
VIVQGRDGCDIVLISPEARKHHMYLPFALLYLSSFLEEKGVSTKIIDIKKRVGSTLQRLREKPFKQTYIDTVISTIKRNNPLLVGLTCYTSEYNSVMEIAKIIKKEANVKVVVGGVHPTLMPQDFLFAESPVDFAIIGDGETPLVKLFESIKQKKEWYKETRGIAYFDIEKHCLVNQGSNVESDLSKFPMPDYLKIDMSFYTKPSIENVRWLLFSGVSIFTGRGCPYNCEFCAVNFLRNLNKEASKMRYRSIDQVIEEIEFLKKEYHIDAFYVIDDCFMVSRERTKEFCLKLIEKKLNMVWGAETRANLLVKDEGLLQLMKKAGLIQLDFGVESGSSEMLKEINKQVSIDQIRMAFEMCKKNGIRTYANILFNIPNETDEDIMLTDKFLKEIKPTVVGCGTTVPLLGTALYEKYVFPKLTPKEYELYNLNVYDAIVDDRFKLNKHKLNLTPIVRKLNKKYNELRTMSFRPIYWRKVFTSYHLSDYLLGYLNMFIKPVAEAIVNIGLRVFQGRTRELLKSVLKRP